MREYPDPHTYMEQHLEEAARRDRKNLRQAGLPPNETLARALAERALQEAEEAYNRQVEETLYNIQGVLGDLHRRDQQIKREGQRWGFKVFSILTLAFAILAWFTFSQQDIAMGILYSAGALAFPVLLIWSAFFNK